MKDVSRSIADLLRRRGRTAKPPTPSGTSGRPVRLPATDGDDTTFNRSRGPTAGIACQITYVDAKGQESERRITIRRLAQKGSDLLLYSWCHEREAWRCFYGSRIEGLIDLKTGEVVDEPDKWLSSVASLLGVKPEEKTDFDRETRELLNVHKIPIHVLLFLARCDGGMHTSERTIVREYIVEKSPSGLPHGDQLEWYLDRVHPDIWVYNQALAGIRPWPEDDIVRLLQYAQQMIQADGALSAEEQAFSIELSTAILQR